tara:strand:- start:332 stop:1630 length:1299 start_codon:yes stop_codon:yes gene_type:complete
VQNQKTKNQYYTKFIDKSGLKQELAMTADEFVNSFSGLFNLKNLLSIDAASGYEFINFIALKHSWPEYIRKIYLQCYFTSENLTPGSGCVSTYFLAKRFLNYKMLEPQQYNMLVQHSDYTKIISSAKSLIDFKIRDFIFDIIEFSGINGNVIIENSNTGVPVMQAGSGHTFNIGLDLSFLSNKEKRQEVKLIIFDGSITDVGQVDRIFSECSEKKISCVIIARSFGNDVMSTINVNHRRDTLDILPITVQDAVENINTINDIGVSTGASVITSESGIRLSNISIDDLVTIHDVILTKNNFSFAAKIEQSNAISNKINKILDRINTAVFDDDMSYEDINKVFIPRIMSLSSNSVNVWVPGDKKFLFHIRKNFDFSIKVLSAFANSGMVNTADIFKDNTALPDLLPANFIDASIVASQKVYFAINNSGGCVAIQ